MLVARLRSADDDEGAVLLTVVVVMLVGFVIAATVAASVIFTITANAGNKSTTQAFIAAESGRDAALAHLAGTCNAAMFPLTSSGSLNYSATVAVTTGSQPSGPTDAGVATGCPTENTTYVVITSTGTGADGSSTTVDAVYPWIVAYELQAGGVLAYFASGVSLRGTYAGDIVVRSGNYTCAADGTLDGDLYVTRGNAVFSRDCTVYGDVWTYGDVDGSSQRINITGNVKAGGTTPLGSATPTGTFLADVTFTSNGTVIGTQSDPETGAIEATGDIDLTNTGSTDGRGWGNLTAGGAIAVGSKWIIDPTAARAPSTMPPAFEPTLEFIREITAWMDLDHASDWGVTPVVGCGLSSAQLITLLDGGGTDPIAFDYTSCGSEHVYITLPSGNHELTRDAVFLLPPSKVAHISLDGNLAGDHQLVFLHEDGSRNLVSGETSPTCGNGNQRDNLDIGAGLIIEARLMVYAPCGLNGTVNSSFRGQLYSNDTSGVTFIGTADYTCALMSWEPAFEKLGCKVRGEGEDVVLETVLVQRLGVRMTQSER
jgi:hypothetical protein